MAILWRITIATSLVVALLVGMPGAAATAPDEPIQIRSPLVGAGATSLVLRYVVAKGIDRKHGIALDVSKTYESMVTYYQDFFQGSHDVVIGTWDTIAMRYLAGAPVRMIGTFAQANIASIVVRTESDIQSVRDLRGKLVAVPTGTGTYRMSQAFFAKFFNLEFGKDIQILNVPGGTQGPTYVGAKRADAALSWEPAISIAMYRAKNMRVLTTMGRIFKDHTGHDLFYYIVAMRTEKLKSVPGVATKIVAMLQDAAQQFEASPDEALTLAAKELEIDREAMLDGLKSRRLTFDVRPATDPAVVTAMRVQLDFMTEQGLFDRKVPADFLYSGR